MSTHSRRLVLWALLDGRRGHFNQVIGLCEAIGQQHKTELHRLDVPAGHRWRNAVGALGGRLHRTLPDPDLIVGAGHSTHLPLLLLRRLRGGRSVCLMKPTLPTRLFDLCIIPAHDGVGVSERIVLTRGPPNRVRPVWPKRSGTGLILVGGPSRGVRWNDDVTGARVRAIIASDPTRNWTIASSPRTPDAVVDTLAGCETETVAFVPYQRVNPDWLPGVLADTELAWVTEDSASMLYEALSAGAATGIIEVQCAQSQRSGRIARGIEALAHGSLVVWSCAGVPPRAPQSPLAEAERCARLILDRWFPNAA